MATGTSAYSSFSGIDIIAVIGEIVVGTLQGISYSITREKAPIYTFGSANPRSFSRGKRGLAGSMIFTLFDRSALYNIMNDDQKRYDYYAHMHEELTLVDNTNVWDWANAITQDIANNKGVQTEKKHAEYLDQIMPFNITLIAQNEYGLAAWKAIIGIEILNEGGGLSVDDITNEEQTTYVARAATAWVPWVQTSQGATGNFFAGNGGVSGELLNYTTGSVQPFSGANQANLLSQYQAWLKA